MAASVTAADDVRYVRVPTHASPDKLFDFRMKEGKSPMNFLSDVRPLRAHFERLPEGTTLVWAAYEKKALVGFVSAELGGEYHTEGTRGATVLVRELVVAEGRRRRGVGGALARLCVDAERGIFAARPETKEVYATAHAANEAGIKVFTRAGFEEVVTYADFKRGGRETTLLRRRRPPAAESPAEAPPPGAA